MKSIVALRKLSLFLAFALLFCSLPVVHVEASSVTDQSKPIFGLTADDVVDKYNQLSDQQKDQVLRSLGNTSIFSNSLFGNIFNSTFGVLDDAVKKIGDLFFQANGIVYKLGSSALAWVSRLIDKVFNNDLSDLNISQPVVDDIYLNTRSLMVEGNPFFRIPNKPSGLSSSMYSHVFPTPTGDYDYIYYFNYYVPYVGILKNSSLTYNGLPAFWGIFVNASSKQVGVCYINYSVDDQGRYLLRDYSFNHAVRQYDFNSDNILWHSYGYVADTTVGSFNTYSYVFEPSYLPFLQELLYNNFIYATYYYYSDGTYIYKMPIQTQGDLIDITNNTYYNYIYNIPDQTPLNVYNIVSNTAIDYSPANNIAYYLPDQYDIEQNFTVVNNYYISSGSAITSQGSIDVNLVSPSVIDVRIINPEDISSEVINENNTDIINNYDFDFGDLNINSTVGTGIDNARDNLSHVVTSSSVNVINGFVSGIPSDWKIAIFAFMALGFIILVINKVIGK